MSMDFEFDDLVNFEQKFYDEGFKDGYDHGRIHGMIEGRALGRQKGYEIWEELGFYEGFALCWRSLLDAESSEVAEAVKQNEDPGRSRQMSGTKVQDQISSLLSSISKFPTSNPSPTPSSTASEEGDRGDVMDLTRQLSQIRSKYKLLCSLIGVKPRPIPAPSATLLEAPSSPTEAQVNTSDGFAVEIELANGDQSVTSVEGKVPVEGRVQRPRKSVWALQGKSGMQHNNPPLTPGSLSF